MASRTERNSPKVAVDPRRGRDAVVHEKPAVRSGLGDSGFFQKRRQPGCDVVGALEAASRMGVARAGLLARLRARKGRTLLIGYGGWLVDLCEVATKRGLDVEPSGVVIIERGQWD